jgi:serine/threonine protein kinase
MINSLLANRYRIVREIASGGMGTVYEAFQEDLRRRVVVKVVRADAGSAEDFERLRREANAAASLNHPHIAQVLDFVAQPGTAPFVVMELLEGHTLSGILSYERRLEPQRALRLINQVLSALDAAHRIHIVHRDIKPSNLFVTRSATLGEIVKILDFGIAKSLDANTPALTAQGTAIGTLQYMSPEQFRGLSVDGRADIFSAGLVLYELLSGLRGYASASDPFSLSRMVHRGVVPPLHSVAPAIHPMLADIVMRALAPDPNQRFRSARDMQDALLAFEGTARTSLQPSPPTTRSESAPTGSALNLTASAPHSTASSGRRWIAPLALLVVGLVAFAAGIFGVLHFAGRAPAVGPTSSADANGVTPAMSLAPSVPTVALGASCNASTDAGVAAGMVCLDPAKVWACAPGFSTCQSAARCSDLKSDMSNCGTCGKVCSSQQSCAAGKCVSKVALARTPATAGGSMPDAGRRFVAIGRPCAGEADATSGNFYCDPKSLKWTCARDTVLCGETCSPVAYCNSCGGPGISCRDNEACSKRADGTLACAPCGPAQGLCRGARCWPLLSPQDCGRCGNTCAQGSACVGGVCTP